MTDEGRQVVETLIIVHQDAMACVQGLSEWLAEGYLKALPENMQSASGFPPGTQLLAERTAFGRVLSLLASLARSHTVDIRPSIINVVYKGLIKVLERAALLMPSAGFWTACFDGQALASAMLQKAEASLHELFALHGDSNLPLSRLSLCPCSHALTTCCSVLQNQRTDGTDCM